MEMPPAGGDFVPPPPVHSPFKQISWQASDPDGDPLSFRVQYREESAKVWLDATDDPVTAPQARWNTESVADGRYFVKVVASDHRANPEGEALRAEESTGPVVVDNAKPVVAIRESVDGRIKGSAKDNLSRIARLEIQVDGGAWQSFPCKDGIFDSTAEEFETAVELRKLASGLHTVTLRATDEELNTGLARVTIKVE
jgi:hypothetical protein